MLAAAFGDALDLATSWLGKRNEGPPTMNFLQPVEVVTNTVDLFSAEAAVVDTPKIGIEEPELHVPRGTTSAAAFL